MKPELDRVLEICVANLMTDIAPNVAPSYRQANVMSTGLVLVCLREELDRIAERRVVENRALRALFADAVSVVADSALEKRLESASRGEESDFRISALDAENDALRALLVELHAHLETLPGDEALPILSALWRELAASTERRRLGIGSF